MGVVVPNVKRLKRTPKKTPVVAEKKITPKRKAAAVKSKPETKANNTTPKPKAVKSKPAPKKKSPKKKPVVNNTPAKKEQVNNSASTNNVPEKKESSRKRAAPKIENDVPAKKTVKEKPAVATPAKKKPGRGRPPKANNVISPKKKETPKKPVEKPESTPVKATNDVKKKQSKSKQAKKSPAKAKKAVVAKTPKKTPTVEKTGSNPKVNKAKATGKKQAKRGPAAKTKSVYLNPVIEIEPIEHFKAMTQVTRDFWIVLHRMNEVKRNVRVVLPRMEALNKLGTIISHKEERNPLNKKYQPYMEKIEQLSAEEISNFVRKNKDYYVKKLNNIGKNDGNSKNSELKDQFKCHPFNSSQQLAMYLTLREIFNVPKSHFIECRNFFTVLMPEISCQLFAEIFHTKITSVPKLIKKLYPSAVSPF